MKREFLFRGISTISGKWVYGSLITTMDNTFILECDETIEFKDWRSDINTYRVKPETVGQYIERKDKFGKKIFEGDIVKATIDGKNMNGIVVSDPETHTFYNAWVDDDSYYDPLDYRDEFIEISGNKYENLIQ